MENIAIINLKQLRFNANKIKRTLPKKTLFCAVVKADAYGHGLESIADALYTIADWFSVTTVEEGVRLRMCGIDKPILVLSPIISRDYELAMEYFLTLGVESLEQVKFLFKMAKKGNGTIDVHVKFNTGMNRLGVNSLSELKEILDFTKKGKYVKITGLYSHYFNPENVRAYKMQTKRFLLANKLVKSYNKEVISHISASAGYLKGEYFDMVRIGILLYGYLPYKTTKISVKPIMKVYAPVIKTLSLRKGQSCLYGNCPAKDNLDVSLIRFGYADGINRAVCDGQFNNKCMDITAVIGSIKKGALYPVMENADEIAKKYNTISYEVLSKCAIRAKKIYRR
jgi:alanine racemase